jgi:HD domain-containing protein
MMSRNITSEQNARKQGDNIVTRLERLAEQWIAPYWNAQHLMRTRDWALELDPHLPEAVRIAALTHDVERMVPGGPAKDPSLPPDDESYNNDHSERSAELVAGWLSDHGAGEPLIGTVRELILLHEWGGTPEADIVQAADSIAFLEVNPAVVFGWLNEGRATPDQARAKLEWMFGRIRVERARKLAAPFYHSAIRALAGEIQITRR